MATKRRYGKWDRIPMQYLIIEARQNPDFEHEEPLFGVVGCWIKDQTQTNAYYVAKGWIEANGWIPTKLDDQYPVYKSYYRNNKESREYYEQALLDDEVFVFHTSPLRKKSKRPAAKTKRS